MPLLITALPTLGLAWLGSGPVEWALVSLSGGIAYLALRKGQRSHGRSLPGAVASLGFLGVVLSLFFESTGGWVTALRVLGGLGMVLGHVLNAIDYRSCAHQACGLG